MATIAEKLGQVTAQNQYTVLADTDHRQNHFSVFVQDGVMGQMAANGVRHLCLEWPTGYQGLFDALASGEITREAFVASTFHGNTLGKFVNTREEIETVADTVLEAGANGIKVHMVDGREGFDQKELVSLRDTMDIRLTLDAAKALTDTPSWLEAPPEDLAAHIGDLKSYRAETSDYHELTDRINVLEETYGDPNSDMSTRLDQDFEVAARIKEVTLGEKAVVMYGNMHISRKEGDLDHGLGPENTAVVGVFMNEDTGNNWFAKQFKSLVIKQDLYTEEPDYGLYLEENKWVEKDGSITMLGTEPSSVTPASDPDPAAPPEPGLAESAPVTARQNPIQLFPGEILDLDIQAPVDETDKLYGQESMILQAGLEALRKGSIGPHGIDGDIGKDTIAGIREVLGEHAATLWETGHHRDVYSMVSQQLFSSPDALRNIRNLMETGAPLSEQDAKMVQGVINLTGGDISIDGDIGPISRDAYENSLKPMIETIIPAAATVQASAAQPAGSSAMAAVKVGEGPVISAAYNESAAGAPEQQPLPAARPVEPAPSAVNGPKTYSV